MTEFYVYIILLKPCTTGHCKQILDSDWTEVRALEGVNVLTVTASLLTRAQHNPVLIINIKKVMLFHKRLIVDLVSLLYVYLNGRSLQCISG